MFHYFSTKADFDKWLYIYGDGCYIATCTRNIPESGFPCLVHSEIQENRDFKDELCVDIITTKELLQLIPMSDIMKL